MTAHLGSAALAAGVAVSVGMALLWLRVALAGRSARAAHTATWLVLAAAAVACLLLEWALVSHDFGVRYVAENGGRGVPLYFTVTSLWAALDGSLLLWLLILGGYGVLLARSVPRQAPRLHPWAMTVVAVVCVFFFALAYFAANPFEVVEPAPVDGPGPNPLLREHPAMGMHPPLLYAGYVGLVVPFAYGLATLICGRAHAGWLAATRRWTLISWSFLTAGILLGAWWAYAVLGWGGYWAWDPVENASLLPWLTATAFLHAALRPGRGAATGDRRANTWTVPLACASFLLVLVGTFLTRSSVVASVHSFTQSPLGPMLLGFVLLATATVLGLLLWRGDRLPASGPDGAVLSRETALRGNTVLLTTLAAVVLTGTLFPVISEALTGARSAVGPAYFNRTAVPVALAVLVLMGVGPLVRWRADSWSALAGRLTAPAAAGLGTVAVVGLISRPGIGALAAFGLAAFVLAGIAQQVAGELLRDRSAPVWRSLMRRRRWYAALVAHAGIAVLAVGVAASSAYASSQEAELSVGEEVTVAGATARLVAVAADSGGAATTVTARLELSRGGTVTGTARGTATPRLRHFPARDLTVAVPSIRSGLTGDIYTTVTAVDARGRTATVRLTVNPLVSLVWLGGGLTALGGLLALGRRRPAERPPATRPEPTAAEVVPA